MPYLHLGVIASSARSWYAGVRTCYLAFGDAEPMLNVGADEGEAWQVPPPCKMIGKSEAPGAGHYLTSARHGAVAGYDRS